MGEDYKATQYNSEVLQFIGKYGGDVSKILFFEPVNSDATPSGDYTMTTSSTGMTNLSGYTTIWNGSAGTYDNFSSDKSIGFSFYFYQQDDPSSNTQVSGNINIIAIGCTCDCRRIGCS